MLVKEFLQKVSFYIENEGDLDREIIGLPFCCDLLSIAMSRAPYGCAWVTVMANVNTIAVAKLAEVSVLILAEGSKPDMHTRKKAKEQQITLCTTELSVYEAARLVEQIAYAETVL